jgi:hypothetical protein
VAVACRCRGALLATPTVRPMNAAKLRKYMPIPWCDLAHGVYLVHSLPDNEHYDTAKVKSPTEI